MLSPDKFCVLIKKWPLIVMKMSTNMSNLHPLEVVSSYRDPQLQMGENHTTLFIYFPIRQRPLTRKRMSLLYFHHNNTFK